MATPGSAVIDPEKLKQLMSGGPNVPMIAPPLGGAPASPQLPALNFKQRQALPTTSPGVPEAGSLQSNVNRLQRIQDQQANPWGSAENHPGTLGKIGHVLGTIGNDIGEVADPAAMARIPGTTANRAAQEQGLQKTIDTEQTERTRERHESNIEDTNESKIQQAQQKIDETENKDKSAREIALRKQGLKQDEQGNAVPLQYEDMSPTEQAVHDLKVAQADSATARSLVDQMRANPDSPQNQAIRDRIKVMAKNAATAAGKLGLDKKKFLADYYGTDEEGNPIAGAPTEEKTGKPIGPKMAKAAESQAPGAERLKRSDLAYNVLQNSGDLRQMIKDNPNLFGQIAGHFTTAQQLIGSDNPAIAKIGIAIHNVALASNGAHGLRSAEAVKETEDKLLNHFRNGTEATTAALDEIDKSVGSFIEAAEHGKKPMKAPAATGGGAPQGAPKAGDVIDGYHFKGGDPSDQKNWVKQ